MNSVPYHGGLSEELYFSDDDRGDEPDHDQLGDDPLPLDVLLLALLLERVAVDVLAPGGLVVTLVTPPLLPPRGRIRILIVNKFVPHLKCHGGKGSDSFEHFRLPFADRFHIHR